MTVAEMSRAVLPVLASIAEIAEAREQRETGEWMRREDAVRRPLTQAGGECPIESHKLEPSGATPEPATSPEIPDNSDVRHCRTCGYRHEPWHPLCPVCGADMPLPIHGMGQCQLGEIHPKALGATPGLPPSTSDASPVAQSVEARMMRDAGSIPVAGAISWQRAGSWATPVQGAASCGHPDGRPVVREPSVFARSVQAVRGFRTLIECKENRAKTWYGEGPTSRAAWHAAVDNMHDDLETPSPKPEGAD